MHKKHEHYLYERCLTISATVMMTRNKGGGGLKDEGKFHYGEEVNMKKLIRSTKKGGYECNMFFF